MLLQLRLQSWPSGRLAGRQTDRQAANGINGSRIRRRKITTPWNRPRCATCLDSRHFDPRATHFLYPKFQSTRLPLRCILSRHAHSWLSLFHTETFDISRYTSTDACNLSLCPIRWPAPFKTYLTSIPILNVIKNSYMWPISSLS